MQPNYPQDTPPQSPQPQPQPLPQPQQPPAYQQPQPQYFNEQPQQPAVQPQYDQSQYGGPSQDPYNQQLQPNLYGSQPEPQPVSMIATDDKSSKKPMIIIFIAVGALLLVGLIAGGVYAWQSGMFGTGTEEVVEETQEQAPAENTYDTPELIETEIVDTQKALDAIDDSQLADDTISDQTLNQ